MKGKMSHLWAKRKSLALDSEKSVKPLAQINRGFYFKTCVAKTVFCSRHKGRKKA